MQAEIEEIVMSEQRTTCDAGQASDRAPAEAGAEARGAGAYCRPRLEFVGTVTRLVQSGPVGSRYETYQGSYWSPR